MIKHKYIGDGVYAFDIEFNASEIIFSTGGGDMPNITSYRLAVAINKKIAETFDKLNLIKATLIDRKVKKDDSVFKDLDVVKANVEQIEQYLERGND